ncbi:hypothetical protein CARUB_v10011525mg [Capsella rubella]|uniref:Uncharacterized protein n=1 Tax=Capsella rubella TaxID=81985 RepID=R0GT91_9BRAS|nr:hypothetical protein CARUB_v10011525mg [Capsella rubella]
MKQIVSVSLPHSMHLLLPLPLTSSVINTNSFSALSGLERLKEQQMLGLDTLMIVYNAFKQNIHEDPNWCCENLHQNLQAMLDTRPHLERTSHYLTAKDNQKVPGTGVKRRATLKAMHHSSICYDPKYYCHGHTVSVDVGLGSIYKPYCQVADILIQDRFPRLQKGSPPPLMPPYHRCSPTQARYW